MFASNFLEFRDFGKQLIAVLCVNRTNKDKFIILRNDTNLPTSVVTCFRVSGYWGGDGGRCCGAYFLSGVAILAAVSRVIETGFPYVSHLLLQFLIRSHLPGTIGVS